MKKLPYSLESLAELGGIKVVVSKFVLDNKIVFREYDHQKHGLPYKISIWDLDTGKIAGDADPTKAEEMYVSPYRFDELKRKSELNNEQINLN